MDERYKHGYGGKEIEQVNNTGTEQENTPAFLTLKIPVVGFQEKWKKKQHQTRLKCSFHQKKAH